MELPNSPSSGSGNPFWILFLGFVIVVLGLSIVFFVRENYPDGLWAVGIMLTQFVILLFLWTQNKKMNQILEQIS